MKPKKPNVASKPVVKAEKPTALKAKAPSNAKSLPAKKKTAQKKAPAKKTKTISKAKSILKAGVNKSVKRDPAKVSAKAKTTKSVKKTKAEKLSVSASARPATQRVPLRKLSVRPVRTIRRPKRVIKLPSFLRRPPRKYVRRAALPLTSVEASIEPTLEAALPAPPTAKQERPAQGSKAPPLKKRGARPTLAAPATSSPATDFNPAQVSIKPAPVGIPKVPSVAKLQAATPKQRQPRRAPASLKRAVELPAILFEGDHPAQPLVHAANAQSSPPAGTPQISATREVSLPEAYGTRRVTVTARDPHWLCVHWDLTREQLRHYNAQSVHRHLVLRVHENKAQDDASGEIHVHPESRHWFVHVPKAAAKHVIELGYYRKQNGWVRIGVSDPTATPPAIASTSSHAKFATIPLEVSLPRLLEITNPGAGRTVSLVDAIENMRAAGHLELSAVPAGSLPSTLTPELERALLELIRQKHSTSGIPDSAGIGELQQRGLPESIFSTVMAAVGNASSPSSPYGGTPPGPQGFWFNINAEVVLYGATEPSASVTIGGQPVPLRSDGSFSLRFILPDGDYELPVTAVSADGTEARHAELKLRRATDYIGDVGQQPQDPSLKAPIIG